MTRLDLTACSHAQLYQTFGDDDTADFLCVQQSFWTLLDKEVISDDDFKQRESRIARLATFSTERGSRSLLVFTVHMTHVMAEREVTQKHAARASKLLRGIDAIMARAIAASAQRLVKNGAVADPKVRELIVGAAIDIEREPEEEDSAVNMHEERARLEAREHEELISRVAAPPAGKPKVVR